MPFDGIVVSSIVHELKEKIVNGKIEKIYQPESDEINILIRCFKQKYKLLISASSNNPRIHLTKVEKTNPLSPPMFCMLMRKHLQGGIILDIKQKEFERILLIDIESYDELGFLSKKQLIIEIMGKHSNIILIDKENGQIIDSVKRVSSFVNRHREILPGRDYIEPPKQDKQNPLCLDSDSFISFIKNRSSDTPIFKAIYTSLQGISPLAAREICYRCRIDDEQNLFSISDEKLMNLWNEIQSFTRFSDGFSPNIITSKIDHHIIDFYPVPLKYYEMIYNFNHFESISYVLEEYYKKTDLFNRLKQKSTDLRRFVSNSINKLYKKNQKLQEELIRAEKSQKYKVYGELLTAYLYLINQGDTEIELANFYDDSNEKILIQLDSRLTPSQNAQKYFKKYTKSKNALKEIAHQLQETDTEITYFENLLHSLENASNMDGIDEIKLELIEEGYMRKRKNSPKQKKNVQTKPVSFISSDGFLILVGKNNKQNDQLTLKTASKKDLWFHTKDIPGSHVVILCKNEEIPERTILEAAELAAFHSKGKQSSNVPIDYTTIKNVKKPSGAKPGMVIYENNKTVYVTPRHNIVELLNKNKELSQNDFFNH